MRLDKFICRSTSLDGQQAHAKIKAGYVSVNHKVITDATQQVHENNSIILEGKTLFMRPPRYLMYHKPAGTLCSHKDGVYPSIFNGLDIPQAETLHLVGRLDADTTGLVLLTDDGRWSYRLTHPDYRCNKTYRVKLRNTLAASTIDIFSQGLILQGEAKPTLPAKLQQISAKEVLLTLTEGRFHQVKRMFAAVSNKVVGLHREQIAGIGLDVPVGKWRDLTQNEINNDSVKP
ncbi:MAG: pseudouridine synthase [Oceanisphaera sp.]|uniref:pseudouridine synthase n=1 Tax=Oceanisphaera sp. TaxID=1929979 RepID=UPI003F9A6121